MFQRARYWRAAGLGILCQALLVHRHEMALGHGDTAMNHGVVHRAPDAYGTQHRLGVEAGTHQLQTAAVDHKEVGALAHRQLADIVPAQQPALPRVAIFSTS